MNCKLTFTNHAYIGYSQYKQVVDLRRPFCSKTKGQRPKDCSFENLFTVQLSKDDVHAIVIRRLVLCRSYLGRLQRLGKQREDSDNPW